MKILVTGGFGFVGARLAQALRQAGHALVLGSRSARSAPDWLPDARVLKLDWQSRAALQQACEGVDVVIHAAGMNAAACAADAPLALEVNGVATASLVDAAVAAGVQRMFYLSTAHVYASPLRGDIDEESCARNVHPYASSHLAGEYALQHALVTRKLAGASLRLSNGFGAPLAADTDCWTLLTNDLCRQAITGRKLVLQSSGDQRRDFIALSAIADDVLRLLSAPAEDLPPTINLGSGDSLAVIDMARLIQARCQATLGFLPALEVGTRKEAPLPLRYGSLFGERLGFTRPLDPTPEIDALLAWCQANFAGDAN